MGRIVEDAVVTVVHGSLGERPDHRHASVVITGTALTWGGGGIVGQDTAIDQFLDSSIWIQSGQIDGVVENSTIRVNRVTRVDPRSGDVDFNDLDRNLQLINQICENTKTNIK